MVIDTRKITSAEDLELMYELLEHTWGTRALSVLDPFAGGGSIPFEALRYGFTTIANDLNPVAAVILKATLDYPAIGYGLRYASVVGRGRLYGVQFHPEKSQRVGLAILRNFVEEG